MPPVAQGQAAIGSGPKGLVIHATSPRLAPLCGEWLYLRALERGQARTGEGAAPTQPPSPHSRRSIAPAFLQPLGRGHSAAARTNSAAGSAKKPATPQYFVPRREDGTAKGTPTGTTPKAGATFPKATNPGRQARDTRGLPRKGSFGTRLAPYGRHLKAALRFRK